MFTCFAIAPLAPAVVLPVLGVGAAIAAGFLLFSAMKSKSSGGILGHLQAWNQSPEMQLIAKAVASRIAAFGEATGHQLLDAALVKMIPGIAPLLPTINTVVSNVEKQIAGEGTTPTPAQPGSIVIHSGHPLFDLIQKLMEAKAAEQKAKSA